MLYPKSIAKSTFKAKIVILSNFAYEIEHEIAFLRPSFQLSTIFQKERGQQ